MNDRTKEKFYGEKASNNLMFPLRKSIGQVVVLTFLAF
jgi:hypothetical protein